MVMSKAKSRRSSAVSRLKSPKFKPASPTATESRNSAQSTISLARSMKSSIGPRSISGSASFSRSSMLISPSPLRSSSVSQLGNSLSMVMSAVMTSRAVLMGSISGAIASKIGNITFSRKLPRSSVTSFSTTLGNSPKVTFWSVGLTSALMNCQSISRTADTDGSAPVPKSAAIARPISAWPFSDTSRKSCPISDRRNKPSLFASVRSMANSRSSSVPASATTYCNTPKEADALKVTPVVPSDRSMPEAAVSMKKPEESNPMVRLRAALAATSADPATETAIPGRPMSPATANCEVSPASAFIDRVISEPLT
ncbi:hypothetical protein PEV8663_03080 [Pelagimonas varians]|uniref:Uncharacterized protein n=1 Tax=Pelagimonas varians TaxID=696760 RepID=A0A238KSR6_9RHOB|nr:hypothetical protein PEV8663_03080 [Pelagimonas varians]